MSVDGAVIGSRCAIGSLEVAAPWPDAAHLGKADIAASLLLRRSEKSKRRKRSERAPGSAYVKKSTVTRPLHEELVSSVCAANSHRRLLSTSASHHSQAAGAIRFAVHGGEPAVHPGPGLKRCLASSPV